MVVEKFDKAIPLTWQDQWPAKVQCQYCSAPAELIVAVKEDKEDEFEYIYAEHDNGAENGSWWPHDAMAIANYLCRGCFKITAIWNQA